MSEIRILFIKSTKSKKYGALNSELKWVSNCRVICA